MKKLIGLAVLALVVLAVVAVAVLSYSAKVVTLTYHDRTNLEFFEWVDGSGYPHRTLVSMAGLIITGPGEKRVRVNIEDHHGFCGANYEETKEEVEIIPEKLYILKDLVHKFEGTNRKVIYHANKKKESGDCQPIGWLKIYPEIFPW